MKLTVVWHKPCWPCSDSPTGYAARGCLGDPGFGGLPHQIEVLSELFDATRIVAPCSGAGDRVGEVVIRGKDVSVASLTWLSRSGWRTWPALPFWLVRNGPTLAREITRADAVFAFIPSPIGLLGLVLALACRKPLLARQLNPWSDSRWLWRLERALLERAAGGRNVVFATGDSGEPPSRRNRAIRWLFCTAMSEGDLSAASDPRTLATGPGVRLASVGREVDPRGARTLLRTVALLAQDHPQVTLDIVGDGTAASCGRLATELRVSDRVAFHGSVSRERMLTLLRRADLLCLPAEETEGSRQALHEALACGLPVVAARRAAPPAMVEGCGILLDEGTPEAFAAGVRACLADAAGYRAMSAAAFRAARRHSVEGWRETVRAALEGAWGPLAEASL